MVEGLQVGCLAIAVHAGLKQRRPVPPKSCTGQTLLLRLPTHSPESDLPSVTQMLATYS